MLGLFSLPSSQDSRTAKTVDGLVLGAVALWTIAIALSLSWNLRHHSEQLLGQAAAEARAHLDKNMAIRRWIVDHGGVYVPIDAKTQPNPYLAHVPERDIATPSGRKLTLMNSSYALRQLTRDYSSLYGNQERISSLKPLNPLNTADPWERKALQSFADKPRDFWELAEGNGEPTVRMMRPMPLEESCLKCHQGDASKIGTVMGGISVSIPFAPYQAQADNAAKVMMISHGGIWVVGLLIAGWGRRFARRQIAEQERVTRDLQQTKARLDIYQQSTPLAYVEWSPDFTVTEWNPAAEYIFGYTRQEALGRHGAELLAPLGEQPKAEDAWTGPAGGKSGYDNINTNVTKNGRAIVCEWSNTPLTDEEGKPIGMISVARDITERVKGEKQLRESEAKFRALFDHAGDAILISDPNGHILEVNAQACRRLGYSRDRLVEMNLADIEPHLDGGRRAQRQEAMAREGSAVCQTTHQRSDGAIIPVEVSCRNISFGDRMAELCIVQDISQRKQEEEALRQLNAVLARRIQEEVEKNREKDHLLIQQSRLASMGEMVHNIAHQWRQPLTSLGLLLANLQDEYDYGELTHENLSTAVTRANGIIRSMSTTIDDFRNFFRPDQARKEFGLARAIGDAITLVEASLRNHGIAIETDLSEEITISGYPSRFSQAILNVLGNAKDAIQENKPVGSGRIHISLARQNDQAVVAVEDNGGGIPLDLLPRIFDPYFTTKEQGSGIGLYMTKTIVEKSMNGSIRADSDDGSTRIEIRIPIAGPSA